MWERKELKKRGLENFKANYWRCVVVGILLVLFVTGTSVSTRGTASTSAGGENDSSSVSVVSDETNNTYVFTDKTTGETHVISKDELTAVFQDPEVQGLILGMMGQIAALLFAVWLVCICLRLLVFNPIEIGCRGFFARNSEYPVGIDEVKAGFRNYGRNVGAMFLRDLFLFLWGMLFLIPAIIKRYSYRMVPYILADDPSIGAVEAITLSRKMMDGQKWKTFLLDLSFIGWDLLTLLTLGLVGVLYANPYQFSTGAELYQVLKEQ